MLATKQSRLLLLLCVSAAGCFEAGCTAALGPGYTTDKQEIRVRFVPDQQPLIRIEAEYRLRNNGNRPLSSLELRLPNPRRFHFAAPQAQWDTHALAFQPSPANPRNLILMFPEAWAISEVHTLHLAVEFQPAKPDEAGLSFAPDAFFLPAEGWSPQLLPARGLFASGGVPPKSWPLTVRVPEDFLVHASGRKPKRSRNSGEQSIRTVQQPKDGYPFVIAGRFHTTQFNPGQETIILWTRVAHDPGELQQPSDALVRALKAYKSMFGDRSGDSHQLWIVECPVVDGCFSSTASNYAKLVSANNEKPYAEMASLDSVAVDLSAGTPEIAAAAAPSLASSWLGYGQNPGFYEQDPPLSALPAFVASRGRESVQGPQVRIDTIRHVLSLIPVRSEPRKPEDAAVVRAKSLLFFYGLQDLYGQDAFNKALSHMLYARRGGGFNLDDLIAAFDQETHHNTAEFVRRWMKHPGVPEDFRARYENAGTSATNTKETMP